MTDTDTIEDRIQTAVLEAQEAFWASISKAFPECETGDMEFASAKLFDDACEAAVCAWHDANRPTSRRVVVTLVIDTDADDDTVLTAAKKAVSDADLFTLTAASIGIASKP